MEQQKQSLLKRFMSGKTIEPLRLAGNEAVAEMIDNVFGASGFNARRLAEACELYSRMINEGATICLTLAGAMTPIGMSGVVNELMRAGFVDFIISTGANLYHDLHRPYDAPMVQGDWQVDDEQLAGLGIARIYDTYVQDDETLCATDRAILLAIEQADFRKPVSTAELHHALGMHVLKNAPSPKKSLLATAAELEVPVYTSSPGDSSIGMGLIVPHMFRRPVQIDPLKDVIETAAIVRGAEKNGAVELGGGSPKNFYMQTQPTLRQILCDYSKGGHDYFIQLTTDAPHYGGLSGATPQEARSWGKLKDARRNNVVVYSCASLTFPLLAQYVLVQCRPRPQKRLIRRLPALVAALRQAAAANQTLLAQLRSVYGKDFQPC